MSLSVCIAIVFMAIVFVCLGLKRADYEPPDPHISEDIDTRPCTDKRLNRRHTRGRRVRLAIASMVKRPMAFETWLRHHLHTIGAAHIFVRAEDSKDELHAVLAGESRVTVDFADAEQQHYFSQMDRQMAFVSLAIERARGVGCTHLLHIDDDELLHCPSGVDAFYAYLASMKHDCITIRNIEAVYDESSCTDPFAGTTTFVTRPPNYTAYANGKSIANLSRSKDIQPLGPHLFTGSNRTIPTSKCVVLHFESSCFERYRAKFKNYRTSTPHACASGSIPFPFYCQSIDDSSFETWRRWKTPSRHDEHTLVRIDALEGQRRA